MIRPSGLHPSLVGQARAADAHAARRTRRTEADLAFLLGGALFLQNVWHFSALQAGVGIASTTLELKELDEFLLARAVEHDSPTLLFRPVIHNIGRNSPLVSPEAAGLLKQAASPAATR